MSNNNDIIYCEDRHVMHENDEDFPERVSGNEMDEQRKQQMAYQYLCHLEEAKTWMEACLKDELPPTTELEEALRTGVILARVGNFFASEIVPLRKIYDRELKRFQARGLHFKHTDNFMYFVRAMEKVGLPKLFYPETTDLYDKKNMPKVIYCVHALSLYLFKLGLAPQMQDLYGKVKFTEEEISAMRKELEKYGIQMPAFSKIGGILESEMPVDEAALHAAIIVINEAIDHGNAKETFQALKNPNAHLTDVFENNEDEYQDLLYKAKGSKCQTSLLKSPGSEDVYDKMLTQAELQGNIAMANDIVRKKNLDNAVVAINDAIDSGDMERLLKALMNDKATLTKVISENGDWYQQTLSEAKQSDGSGGQLSHSEIQEGIFNANNIGEQFRVLESIMKFLNKALEEENVEECHSLLMKPEALLPSVLNRSAYLYYNELNKEKKKKQQTGHSANLTHGEVTEHVKVLTAIAGVNQAIEHGNSTELLKCLKNQSANLENIEDDSVNRYLEQLVAVKKEKAQDCGSGKDDLNQVELQLCIDYVNTEVSEEHALITAVQAINQTIDQSNAAETLTSLLQEPAKLTNVLPENALLYQAVLLAEKEDKKLKTDDQSAELWHDEIQRCIDKCNLYASDAYKLAAGVSKINESLTTGSDETTMEALENSDVNLRGVTRECQSSYHSKLKETKEEKGQRAGPWLEQKIPQGYLFYYNTATSQTSWSKPADFTDNKGLLTKEEIQAVVTKETAKYGRQVYLEANEPQIVRLQAHWRGYLARKAFNERKEFMTRQLPAIIKIQANLKRWIQHKKYKERLEVLHNNDDAIVKIQAWTRMHLARTKYLQRQKYFEDNLPSIVKIQAFMRANLAQHDYRALLNSQDPSVKIVRKFLHLLDQSDLDFEEEIELQKLKAQVVTEIRSNQQLEHDLHGMDIKIGLLVRNKITLQDVIMHNKKLSRKDQDLQSLASKNTKGIKSLSKESQEKLEAYQHLFYLLQTNPVYLAKLIFEMPQSRSTNFMESVILTLYNYASNAREEYLLLKLFETALREEIFSKIDSIQEIVTGNPTVIKMVVGFNRGTRNQGSLRELLQPLVQTVLEDTTLNTTTNPVEIYKNWINQTESETGQASKLPYDVDPEQALEHPEVRTKVEAAMSRLTAATDRFLQSISASVDKIPYGIRYLAMTLRTCLAEKFPNAGQDEILRVVGNLIYYRYMNPAIVAPDAFDIVDVSVDKSLSVEQRRNLGSISKLLQDAASNKKFGGESAHLSSLNPYVENAHQKFIKFFTAASTVEQPESKFNIDEYSDVTMLTKPVIYISIQEICDTHKLLLDHRNAIAPDNNDPLQELLDDAGDQPDVKELIGSVEVQDGQSEEDVLREQAKSEISLTLSNKFEVPEDDDSDLRALFVRTKHLIVDVIRVQAGDTLTEILETPATEEQESEHMKHVKQREKQDSKKEEGHMRKSTSLYGDSNLPMEAIKRKIIRNLRVLENQGLVTTKNNYQDIVNAVARDIRNQRRYRLRRKQELRKLETTLGRLKTKATFYEEQMDYYNRYIETCLDNLAGKETIAQKKEKKKQDGFKTAVKYSAQKLAEKGVILEIEGLPKNQLKNASFEIVPADSGVFFVSAKFMGIPMEKVEIVFQDLLQLQFEGVAVMKMFGKAKVNVNLLIHLLNKKFYGKT